MAEGDIIDTEEVDKDTLEPEALKQLFSKNYKLLCETAVSLKKTYIKHLHATQSLKLAVSVADNSIEVYELNNSSLSRVCRLSGHTKALTELVFDPKQDNLLYSSGQDGAIKLWDTRSGGSCVQEYKDADDQVQKQYECMSVSASARVVCAGSALAQDDAYLVFWDTRSSAPLGGYWNSHTDDITQVKFHREKSEVLTSGSLDGLLNVYNILEPTEDDALTYSLNVENSVDKISWLDERRVASITQSNDVQVWDVETGDQLHSYTRHKVAKSIKRQKEDDCYVVDMFSAADGMAHILAGSYGGNGDVLRSVTACGNKLQPLANFASNKQTVSCSWYDQQRDVLVTCGESGLLSVWCASETEEREPGRLSCSLSRLHVHRHKPY